jgi:cell division septal protein FtsQ
MKYIKNSSKVIKDQKVSRKKRRTKKSVVKKKKNNKVINEILKKIINNCLKFFAFEKINFKNLFNKHKKNKNFKRDTYVKEIDNDFIVNVLVKLLKGTIVMFLLILVLYGLDTAKNFVFNPKNFLIKNVKIKGTEVLDESNIKKTYLEYCFNRGLPEKSNILIFNINELHRFIMKKYGDIIEKLYISRDFDFNISINIKEREPVGLIQTKDSEFVFVDSALNVFNLYDSPNMNYVILNLKNQTLEDLLRTGDISDISKFVSVINNISKSVKQQISEIEFWKDMFVMYLNNGVKVFCNYDNCLNKVENVNLIINTIKTNNNYNKPIEYIDIRFNDIYLKFG